MQSYINDLINQRPDIVAWGWTQCFLYNDGPGTICINEKNIKAMNYLPDSNPCTPKEFTAVRYNQRNQVRVLFEYIQPVTQNSISSLVLITHKQVPEYLSFFAYLHQLQSVCHVCHKHCDKAHVCGRCNIVAFCVKHKDRQSEHKLTTACHAPPYTDNYVRVKIQAYTQLLLRQYYETTPKPTMEDFPHYQCKLKNPIFSPDSKKDMQTFESMFSKMDINNEQTTKDTLERRKKLEHSVFYCETPPKKTMADLGFVFKNGEWGYTRTAANEDRKNNQSVSKKRRKERH